MSPILAIFWTIALLIGGAPATGLPVMTVSQPTLEQSIPVVPQAILSANFTQHDDAVHESASLSEQSVEKEDGEACGPDGWVSPNPPSPGRSTLAQLLTATRERLDVALSDLRSTNLRC